MVPALPQRRAAAPSRPDYGRLHLALRSATPAATARWLVDVFQLEPTGDIPDRGAADPDYTWIELRVGTSFIVLWGGGGASGTDSPFVYVDDLDAHLAARARRRGATIVSPITEHGFRAYTAADCEGRHWALRPERTAHRSLVRRLCDAVRTRSASWPVVSVPMRRSECTSVPVFTTMTLPSIELDRGSGRCRAVRARPSSPPRGCTSSCGTGTRTTATTRRTARGSRGACTSGTAPATDVAVRHDVEASRRHVERLPRVAHRREDVVERADA